VARGESGPTPRPARARILLLVDTPPGSPCAASPVRDWLSSFLPRFGYEVVPAPTPAAAARLLTGRAADVLVADLGTPLARRARVLSRLRRAQPGVPFLLLSPIQSAEERAVASAYGELLYKPCGGLMLLEALDRLGQARSRSAQGGPSPTDLKLCA
jgi:DNA-binding response OmpR family regulator